MKLLIAFILMLHGVTSVAEPLSPWWVVIPSISSHKDGTPYNEKNWGLGLQYDLTDTFSIIGVRYPNSYERWSTAIGLAYSPRWSHFDFNRITIKPGLVLTLATGYDEQKWKPFLIPSVDILWDRKWGVKVITDFQMFVGLSLKFNLGGML